MTTGQGATAGLSWFKSTYSGDHGGDCLEVAVRWTKPGYSGDRGRTRGAACPSAVHVRDSKNANGPQLDVAPGAWAAFVERAARETVA